MPSTKVEKYIAHSGTKGMEWKEHSYIKKENKNGYVRYYYDSKQANEDIADVKKRLMEKYGTLDFSKIPLHQFKDDPDVNTYWRYIDNASDERKKVKDLNADADRNQANSVRSTKENAVKAKNESDSKSAMLSARANERTAARLDAKKNDALREIENNNKEFSKYNLSAQQKQDAYDIQKKYWDEVDEINRKKKVIGHSAIGTSKAEKYIAHSGVKGMEWKNHSYVKKEQKNGYTRYYYNDGPRGDQELGKFSKADEEFIKNAYGYDLDGWVKAHLDRGDENSNLTWERYVSGVNQNAYKRNQSGSSSLGRDRVLSDQTENRLKAQENAKKILDRQSGFLNWEKSGRDGYKKASDALKGTWDLRDSYNYITGDRGTESAANKYAKKSEKASEGVAKIGMAMNAAKRKASGSSSLKNLKQVEKKESTGVAKVIEKGKSLIDKILKKTGVKHSAMDLGSVPMSMLSDDYLESIRRR